MQRRRPVTGSKVVYSALTVKNAAGAMCALTARNVFISAKANAGSRLMECIQTYIHNRSSGLGISLRVLDMSL